MNRIAVAAAVVLTLVLAGTLALGAPASAPIQASDAAGGPSMGDANCDGTVNSIDAALILQFDAGLAAEPRCRIAADVNRDSTTNAVDAALILQYEAGLIENLYSSPPAPTVTPTPCPCGG